jgi:hypothetical protein
MEVILTVVSILVGWLLGWFTNHWYYRKQIAEASGAREEAQRIDEGFARFFEALSQSLGAGNTVAFGRDERGGVRFDVLRHAITDRDGVKFADSAVANVTPGGAP